MIILDTDELTLVQRARGAEYTRLAERLNQADEPICVTIVTFEEQMRGWLSLMASARTPDRQIQVYARLRALLEDFQTRPVLDYDEPAAVVAASFDLRQVAQDRDLSVLVCLAAGCIEHGLFQVGGGAGQFSSGSGSERMSLIQAPKAMRYL